MIYTFRTTPFRESIAKSFPNCFVFGKLKEDFYTFSQRILEERPEYIIGIAKSDGMSRFESIAINRFNGTKKISNGDETIELFVPSSEIEPSKKSTDSFCNWTAYKIAEFVRENKLKAKIIFVHANEKDIGNLLSSFHGLVYQR